MNFSTDGGGFAFSCDDLKLSIDASTWATRLSQLGRMNGIVYIATGLLPNPEYISKILGKRPRDIFIVADIRACDDAQSLKRTFPNIRIALHPACNAKIVLIEPLTVWVSSADFGESLKIESAIGLHSTEAFKKAVDSLFSRLWQEASEIP